MGFLDLKGSDCGSFRREGDYLERINTLVDFDPFLSRSHRAMPRAGRVRCVRPPMTTCGLNAERGQASATGNGPGAFKVEDREWDVATQR